MALNKQGGFLDRPFINNTFSYNFNENRIMMDPNFASVTPPIEYPPVEYAENAAGWNTRPCPSVDSYLVYEHEYAEDYAVSILIHFLAPHDS